MDRFKPKYLQPKQGGKNSLLLGLSGSEKVTASLMDLRKHFLILGASGLGKSYLLILICRWFLLNDIPFVLIDPHGTVYNYLMEYLYVMNDVPELKARAKRITDKVIPVDLSDDNLIYGINPLAPKGLNISEQVAMFSDMLRQSWKMKDYTEARKINEYLKLVSYLAMYYGGNLQHARKMCLDPLKYFKQGTAFRKRLDGDKKIPEAIKDLVNMLGNLRGLEIQGTLGSTSRALSDFVGDDKIRLMVSQKTNLIDFDALIKDRKTLLVNLSVPLLYRRQVATLFTHELHMAVHRREKRKEKPDPIFLVCDELSEMITPDYGHLVSTTSKYGLYLVGAMQSLSQAQDTPEDKGLINQLLTSCRNKAVFGDLVWEEAEQMAKEIGYREIDPNKRKLEVFATKFEPYMVYLDIETFGQARMEGGSESQTTGLTSSTSRGTSDSRSVSDGTAESNKYDYPEPLLFHTPESISQTTSTGNQLANTNSSSEMEAISNQKSSAYNYSITLNYSTTKTPVTFHQKYSELASVTFETIEQQFQIIAIAIKGMGKQHCAYYVNDRLFLAEIPFVSSLDDRMVVARKRSGEPSSFCTKLIFVSNCVKKVEGAIKEEQEENDKFNGLTNEQTINQRTDSPSPNQSSQSPNVLSDDPVSVPGGSTPVPDPPVKDRVSPLLQKDQQRIEKLKQKKADKGEQDKGKQ